MKSSHGVAVWLSLSLVMLAAAPKVTVVDVSASDAIYQDVSHQLVDTLAAALRKAGLEARRPNDEDLPEPPCRFGPCLGKIAASQQADVIVTVDASDAAKGYAVAATALRGLDGLPLAGGRWKVSKVGEKPKRLKKFVAELVKALQSPQPPPQ